MTLFQRRRASSNSSLANLTRPDIFLTLGLTGLILTTPILAIIVLIFDPARVR